ncbi:MAG TPA: hypothetical protein VFW71_01570 [Actinomycetota bacterium]|nr:hypothetical protein [Actinomycetota bacterium]
MTSVRLRRGAMVLAAVLLSGALAACTNANDNPTIGGGNAIGQTSDVTMTAVNGGQAGTAELLESPQLELTVKIALPTAPAATQEPAGIHAGTCTTFNQTVAFQLSPVIRGSSTTSPLATTTINELSSTPYVIVVQRSGTDSTTVSCGAIPQIPTSPTP